jgi:ribonuclease VapC
VVLDSSAIVAILLREHGYQDLARKASGGRAIVGTPTLVECSMVISARMSRDAWFVVRDFLSEMGARVVPFTVEHMHAALRAFLRFGKGRHPAALNMGDCMAYAIADVAKLPLLYTGSDFSKTDIPAA